MGSVFCGHHLWDLYLSGSLPWQAGKITVEARQPLAEISHQPYRLCVVVVEGSITIGPLLSLKIH